MLEDILEPSGSQGGGPVNSVGSLGFLNNYIEQII
jgi:hypothetical protein